MLANCLRTTACLILLSISQLTVASNQTRLIEFSGGPVDDHSSANTPARNLVIRSNLKGKIKFIVKQRISMLDMKIKVKLKGISGANFSDYQVKYHRKPNDANTVLLEVHESSLRSSVKKLNKTSIIVMICVGSICGFATLCAISGCVGIVFYRKYHLKRDVDDNNRKDKHGKERKEETSSRRRKKRKEHHDRRASNADENKPGNDGENEKRKELSRGCLPETCYAEKLEENKVMASMYGANEEKECCLSWRKSRHGHEACCSERCNHSRHGEKSLSTKSCGEPVSVVSSNSGCHLEGGLDCNQCSTKKSVVREQSQRGFEDQKCGQFAELGFSVDANDAFMKKDYIENLDSDDTGLGTLQKSIVPSHFTNETLQNQEEYRNGAVSPSNRIKSYNEHEGRCSERGRGTECSSYSFSSNQSDKSFSVASPETDDRDTLKSKLDDWCSMWRNHTLDGECNQNIASLLNSTATHSKLNIKGTKIIARMGNSAQEYNITVSTNNSKDNSGDSNSGSEVQKAFARLHSINEKSQYSAGHTEVHSKTALINYVDSFVSFCNFSEHPISGSLLGLGIKKHQSDNRASRQSSFGSWKSSETESVNKMRKRTAKNASSGSKCVIDLIKLCSNAHSKNGGVGVERKQGGQQSKTTSTRREFRSKGSTNLGRNGNNSNLFILVALACLSAPIASQPDFELLQTVTADLEIEIPSDIFDSIHVIINNRHENPVTITGDKHFFTLKIFDVNSVSPVLEDKCKGKNPRLCGAGTCDSLTGRCICSRKFKYSDASRKCVPDCRVSCPFETYAATPCTTTTTAVCKKCRSICPAGKYESRSCGGQFNRRCSDILNLPAVKTDRGMISENRMKIRGMRKRVYSNSAKQPLISVKRGSGIEVIINILEADYDVTIGEVAYKAFDKDPTDIRHRMCKHNVPLYYIARRAESKQRFYYPMGKDIHCQNKRFDIEAGAVYCLSLNHDLVRLFTKGEGKASTRYAPSVACKRLIQQCLNCSVKCSKRSKQPGCSKNRKHCYETCKASECDCMKRTCPCQGYVTEKCDRDIKKCAGTKFNKITIEPVFSSQYSYCHARVLHFARYKIRTDLYVNQQLVVSRFHSAIAKPRASAIVDDFGYLKITMPDSLQIDGKDFLLRRIKAASGIEIGRLLVPSRDQKTGPTDALALVPTTPFGISKKSWMKTTCDRVKLGTFKVIGSYPFKNRRAPEIFRKMQGLKLTKVPEVASGGKRRYSRYLLSKSNMHNFLDLHMPRNRSLLRSMFPKSVIDNNRLYCRLMNKKSHWSVFVEGFLKSCPGSLTAKLYDREQANKLLFNYDFAIKSKRTCYFMFTFNIPIMGVNRLADKAYVLHLLTRTQTIKYVLIRERKVARILTQIIIPDVDQEKLLNAVAPVATVAGGLLFLIVLLMIFGVATRPRTGHFSPDSDFHFRHVFVVAWFVAARIAKSILFTVTFITYILIVIHSENYHTLKTYEAFQQREKLVFGNIFKEMEEHRLSEIDRQNRRFIKEKNICEIKLQQLDVYLSNQKRDASWQQQLNKRYKSIKLSAISRFQENWERARITFDRRKKDIEEKINSAMNKMRVMVDDTKRRLLRNKALILPRTGYRMYRAFGGSKTLAQYVSLDAALHRGVKYVNKVKTSVSSFNRFSGRLKTVKDNQEKSESVNFKAWKEQTLSRAPIVAPKLHSTWYQKKKQTVKLDKDLIQEILGIAWIIDVIKSKIFSRISMIVMILIDALLFVYRHTRTYAMAVMMVHGFKKVYDLDKAKDQKEKDEERLLIRPRGLRHGYSPIPLDEPGKVKHGISSESDSDNKTLSKDDRRGAKALPLETSSTSSADELEGKNLSQDKKAAVKSSGRQQKSKQPGIAGETRDVSLTVIGQLGAMMLWFVNKMKLIGPVNIILLNTHLVLIFILMCFVIAGSYFTIITAKYVIKTSVLNDFGYFDAKMTPIVTYRKVVNTRVAVNAFMINHVHIPYYEARMNARIEVYRLKASLFKKLQCTRAVLHNTEFCSWQKSKTTCNGVGNYDDGFYRNLTRFKCHINPALPRRYAKFDKVQFRNELMRSYDPYIEAIRGLILDTFLTILILIGIQVVVHISSKIIFQVLFSFDMIRQIKVYETKQPLETWGTN